MKASDIFFRLMQAATEQGIVQIKGEFTRYDTQGNVNGVCINGLIVWGQRTCVITREESGLLWGSSNWAGCFARIMLNNGSGWTFPDFYEHLKDKEAEPQKVNSLDSQTNLLYK